MEEIRYAIPEAAPFTLEGTRNACCLCIHGFTATPATYIPLSKLLNGLGYAVHVPLLPGHGTTPDALRGITSRQMTDFVERELLSLFERYETVHVVGLSLGGALAAWLAGKYSGDPHFGRLVLMVPALVMKSKLLYLAYPFCFGGGYHAWPPSEPLNDGYDTYRYTYKKMPVGTNRMLLRTGLATMHGLGGITVPTLIMEATQDRTVDPKSSEIAYRRISSRQKELVRYEKSEHNLLMGVEREEVLAKTVAFLQPDRT